jgi:hypothetical protein
VTEGKSRTGCFPVRLLVLICADISGRDCGAFYAAVRKVTANKGKKPPGVDKVLWNTPARKMNAVPSLANKGYKATPDVKGYAYQDGRLVKGQTTPLIDTPDEIAADLFNLMRDVAPAFMQRYTGERDKQVCAAGREPKSNDTFHTEAILLRAAQEAGTEEIRQREAVRTVRLDVSLRSRKQRRSTTPGLMGGCGIPASVSKPTPPAALPTPIANSTGALPLMRSLVCAFWPPATSTVSAPPPACRLLQEKRVLPKVHSDRQRLWVHQAILFFKTRFMHPF